MRDGSEVIPSVTHVFSAGQHLYFYYEVYDPAHAAANTDGQGERSEAIPAIRLLTNVAFFRGKTKAYETPLVESEQLNAPDRKAAIFQLDVPLTQLKPGFYTCQVNVIDDAAGQFPISPAGIAGPAIAFNLRSAGVLPAVSRALPSAVRAGRPHDSRRDAGATKNPGIPENSHPLRSPHFPPGAVAL